jgi:hypothetical protein
VTRHCRVSCYVSSTGTNINEALHKFLNAEKKGYGATWSFDTIEMLQSLAIMKWSFSYIATDEKKAFDDRTALERSISPNVQDRRYRLIHPNPGTRYSLCLAC